MKVIVAGGSGMIGKALTAALAGQGHTVWVLTRDPGAAKLPEGVLAERWDGRTAQGWGRLAAEADAIINISGASIGARPWTNERKRILRASRVDAGRAIVEAVRGVAHRPRVVLQIAGVGYYGSQGDQALTETSPAGSDFLAGVAADWERAVQPVTDMGVRLVVMRTGVVLSPQGGVLAPFILQNRLFAGGPLGSGKQWISWIHIHDLVRVFQFLLAREDASGIYNAAAPGPLTNADFGRAVSQKMGRPFWMPAPAFALRLVLGEMSTLVLDGQRVLPRRLLELGFHFDFDTLQKALDDLIK